MKRLLPLLLLLLASEMQAQVSFGKAERMMKHRIQNPGKKYRVRDFLDKEEET